MTTKSKNDVKVLKGQEGTYRRAALSNHISESPAAEDAILQYMKKVRSKEHPCLYAPSNIQTDEQAIWRRRHLGQPKGRGPESNDGQDPRVPRRQRRHRAETIRYVLSETGLPSTSRTSFM